MRNCVPFGRAGSGRRRPARAAAVDNVADPAGRRVPAAARLLHRQCGAPLDPEGTGRLLLSRATRHFLLCRALCRDTDDRRAVGRSVRSRPGVLSRPGRLCCRLDAVRLCRVALGAGRRARLAGRDGRGDGAAGARFGAGDFPGAGEAARPRHLWGGLRPGRGDRAGARRPPDRARHHGPGMAGDLPDQPAGGDARPAVQHSSAQRDPPAGCTQARSRRHGAFDANARRADRAADRGA